MTATTASATEVRDHGPDASSQQPGDRMMAAVYRRYGTPETVTLEAIKTPTLGAGDVLVRCETATAGAADAAARSGVPWFSRLYFGLRRPRRRVLGSQFAGTVVAAGSDVTKFQVGESVVGITGQAFGAHAQYVRIDQNAACLVRPENLSATEAVALADTTAVAFLRDHARLRFGQRLLVIGATGTVGSLALQLAVHLGAQVTAVCATESVQLARSLGATRVIDYTATDFTEETERFNVIFDAAGKSTFRQCRRLLDANGLYLSTAPSLPLLLRWPWFGGRRARVVFAGTRSNDEMRRSLDYILQLASQNVLRAVVDSEYPAAHIALAHARVDTGHKKGAVVITWKAEQ